MSETLNNMSDLIIPKHISIIMDGNGRWAQAHGEARSSGHIEGVERVRDITEACVELGVRYLSLYTFSEENWTRPQDEVSALMSLLMKAIKNEYATLMDNGVRFRALGNRERLSGTLQLALNKLEKATEKNSALDLCVMLSYSGKWDILQAVKHLLQSGKSAEQIGYEDVDEALVTAGIPDPDLIIRTSGEKRISNYMLWQAAYSEFVFTDTLWPDFKKENLLDAIKEYSSRDRRFGKVK